MFALGSTQDAKARLPVPPSHPIDMLELTVSFLQSGGCRYIYAGVLGVTKSGFYKDQADFLYYSGHGHSDVNSFTIGANKFSPSHLSRGQWKDPKQGADLDIVIFAGCSLMDVTGTQDPNMGLTAHNGKAWAATGPKYFLGYEGYAPLDNTGLPQQIIERWADEWEFTGSFGKPFEAWKTANDAANRHQAAVLDTTTVPREAWHFIKRLNLFWVWEKVPDSGSTKW